MKTEKRASLDLGAMAFILFVVFLVLKLCNVIGWSWWWVTAPLWIFAILYVFVFFMFLVFHIIGLMFS